MTVVIVFSKVGYIQKIYFCLYLHLYQRVISSTILFTYFLLKFGNGDIQKVLFIGFQMQHQPTLPPKH